MSYEDDVQRLVLKPMMAMFKAPTEDVTTAAVRYVERLKIYPPEILEKAWRNVEDSHKWKEWPTLAVIMEECEILTPPLTQPTPTASTYGEDKVRELRVLASPLGQKALREGCAHSLKTFVEDEGRIPTEEEIQAMKDSRDILKREAATMRNSANVYDRILVSIDRITDEHEARLRERFLKDD